MNFKSFFVCSLQMSKDNRMNLKTAIDIIEGCQYEEIEAEIGLESEVKAWQFLIDEGHVWKLQGFYGRTAVDLIEAGVCNPSSNNE